MSYKFGNFYYGVTENGNITKGKFVKEEIDSEGSYFILEGDEVTNIFVETEIIKPEYNAGLYERRCSKIFEDKEQATRYAGEFLLKNETEKLMEYNKEFHRKSKFLFGIINGTVM